MATIHEDIIGGRGYGGFGGGDGFGGGIGLIALLALLGGNRRGGGLFGGDGGGSGVEALNNINSTVDTAAILAKLGNLEGAVPLSEAQIQLALAGMASQLTNQGTANTQSLNSQIQNLSLGQLVQSNTIQTAVAAVDTNVDRQSCAIQTAIHADGEATRSLITTNLIAQLNADKVILANEVSELRHESGRERDRHGVEITMTNNQNQNQMQFQQQSQEFGNLRSLLFEAVQGIRSTNSAINIGGTQLASPTNTNTNVRS